MEGASPHHGIRGSTRGDPSLDEAGVSLDTLLRAPKEKLVYEYDFGNSGEHLLFLEVFEQEVRKVGFFMALVVMSC